MSVFRGLNVTTCWHTRGNVLGRLALLAAGVIFTSGCTASDDHDVAALLDQDFQLRVGQSAMISAEELELGFQAITSDSRCRKGENCFREGDATVRIWMRLAGGIKDENELHTESKKPSAVVFSGYTVSLVALHPVPLSGRDIDPTKYIATFRVMRGLVGNDAIF